MTTLLLSFVKGLNIPCQYEVWPLNNVHTFFTSVWSLHHILVLIPTISGLQFYFSHSNTGEHLTSHFNLLPCTVFCCCCFAVLEFCYHGFQFCLPANVPNFLHLSSLLSDSTARNMSFRASKIMLVVCRSAATFCLLNQGRSQSKSSTSVLWIFQVWSDSHVVESIFCFPLLWCWPPRCPTAAVSVQDFGIIPTHST